MSPIARLAGVRAWLALHAGFESDVVWMLGSGRSGSTWLLNLLRACGDVVGVDEPLIGAHLGADTTGVTSDDADVRTVYDASRGRPHYVFSDAHRAVWAPAVRTLILRSLLADVDRARASRPGAFSRRPLVVVKEPNGSLAAPLLGELLPASRLLFLVRDGRDVIDSSLDALTATWGGRPGRPPLDPAERLRYVDRRARSWVATMAATQAAYDAHDPARRLLVHYERLRADTTGELERVVRWLGRQPDTAALAAIAEKLAFEAIPEERRGAGRFTRAATPGLWKESLTAEEQHVLGELLQPTLTALGYTRDGGLDSGTDER